MSKSQRRIIRKAAIADGPLIWRWHYGPDIWHPVTLGTNWQFRGFADGH